MLSSKDLNCPEFRTNLAPRARQTREVAMHIQYRANKYHTSNKMFTKSRGMCVVCRQRKYVETHHIIPQNKGGISCESNIIKACVDCHNILEDYADRGVYYSPSLGDKIRIFNDGLD